MPLNFVEVGRRSVKQIARRAVWLILERVRGQRACVPRGFKGGSRATQAASHKLGRAVALAVSGAHGRWCGLDGGGDWVLLDAVSRFATGLGCSGDHCRFFRRGYCWGRLAEQKALLEFAVELRQEGVLGWSLDAFSDQFQADPVRHLDDRIDQS